MALDHYLHRPIHTSKPHLPLPTFAWYIVDSVLTCLNHRGVIVGQTDVSDYLEWSSESAENAGKPFDKNTDKWGIIQIIRLLEMVQLAHHSKKRENANSKKYPFNAQLCTCHQLSTV